MQHTQQQTRPNTRAKTGNNGGKNVAVAGLITNVSQARTVPEDAVKREAIETPGAQGPNSGTSDGIKKATVGRDMSSIRTHFMKKPMSAMDRKRNEKMRKARQLRRLRKWLIPKNAIVALHELQGPGMNEFVITSVGNMIKAEIVINNVKYEATGTSKAQAKSKACEKALRDLAISQMNRVKQLQQAKAAAKDMPPVVPPAPSMDESDVDGECSMHGSEQDMEDSCESNDLPVEHLAAFALHKLFSEWESEGFEVPAVKPAKVKQQVAGTTETSTVPNQPSMPKVTRTAADLPADAALRHPTALFAYMRPQVVYQDLGSTSDPPNVEFSTIINVDGMEFTGRGRSKKLARKVAAIEACKTLFGVQFDSSVL